MEDSLIPSEELKRMEAEALEAYPKDLSCNSINFEMRIQRQAYLNGLKMQWLRSRKEVGWISMKEREPDDLQGIMVVERHGAIHAGAYYADSGSFCSNGLAQSSAWCCDLEHFTHWMPLPPSPPKE